MLERRSGPRWARLVLWVLIALFLVMIWGYSAEPATQSSQTSGGISRRVAEWFFSEPTEAQYKFFEVLVRKGAHMTEYAVLMLSLSYALGYSLNPHADGHAFIGVLFWAVTDELHQAFVPGRACRFTDICIDCMGAGYGILLRYYGGLLIRLIQKKRRGSAEKAVEQGTEK